MKPSKNVVIAALGLFSLAASVVAWKCYWRAAELEVTGNADETAALRRQLAEAERRRVVDAATAVRRTGADEGPDADAGAKAATDSPAAGRGRGGRGAEMEAVMAKPEMQRLMALQQKAALDSRYGALFKTLNLSADKLATFKDLLAEKEATMMDTMRVAREQGLDPRSDPEGFKKLMATTQAETDNAIKAAIGEAAFTEYQQYQATQPQRAVVSQLQQSLSYTSEPLTAAQSEQLVQVLAATATTTAGGGPGAGGGGRGGPGSLAGGGTAAITEATVAQAQTVLSGTQLQALQELQALQQAQQAAQKLMREAGVGGPPPAGGGRG
ncbi:MAG: hypothetical protein NTV51_25550 [Verrucomicrobia bacterium]|nr:hypothetical protein [Verrucomicrobiota bacterium]